MFVLLADLAEIAVDLAEIADLDGTAVDSCSADSEAAAVVGEVHYSSFATPDSSREYHHPACSIILYSCKDY